MKIKELIDYIFPRKCIGCMKENDFICKRCKGRIKPLKSQECPCCRKQNYFGAFCNSNCQGDYKFKNIIVGIDYSSTKLIAKIMKAIKYRYHRDIIYDLLYLIEENIEKLKKLSLSGKSCILVPVPTTKRKIKKRGFNQSLVISNYIAKKLNLKVLDLLVLKENSVQQSILNKKDRLKNRENSVYLDTLKLKGLNRSKTIILIDDVASTMSTLNACAKILDKNGFKFIFSFVISRGRLKFKNV